MWPNSDKNNNLASVTKGSTQEARALPLALMAIIILILHLSVSDVSPGAHGKGI